MTPLLALAVGWVLSKMFDVFAHDDGGKPPATGPTPRRRPANGSRRTPAAPASTAVVPVSTRPQAAPAVTTVPWPQVAPTGLPPFPGAGWEPDEPPPSAVVSRAQQLLSQLWAGGEGTFKPEQTAGRWIIYRASRMGDKKGVVAFRESRHAGFLTPPATADELEAAPVSTTVPASTSRTSLPTLRRGSKGEEVRIVQRKLGLLPVDGDFGPATEAGVKNFQARSGLTPDGVVGPKTWTALVSRSAA